MAQGSSSQASTNASSTAHGSGAIRRRMPSSSNQGASSQQSNSVRTRVPRPASQGILKFYTEDTPGLKVGPQTVLVLTLAFMAIVVLLHIVGKFRQAS